MKIKLILLFMVVIAMVFSGCSFAHANVVADASDSSPPISLLEEIDDPVMNKADVSRIFTVTKANCLGYEVPENIQEKIKNSKNIIFVLNYDEESNLRDGNLNTLNGLLNATSGEDLMVVFLNPKIEYKKNSSVIVQDDYGSLYGMNNLRRSTQFAVLKVSNNSVLKFGDYNYGDGSGTMYDPIEGGLYPVDGNAIYNVIGKQLPKVNFAHICDWAFEPTTGDGLSDWRPTFAMLNTGDLCPEDVDEIEDGIAFLKAGFLYPGEGGNHFAFFNGGFLYDKMSEVENNTFKVSIKSQFQKGALTVVNIGVINTSNEISKGALDTTMSLINDGGLMTGALTVVNIGFSDDIPDGYAIYNIEKQNLFNVNFAEASTGCLYPGEGGNYFTEPTTGDLVKLGGLYPGPFIS